MTSTATAISADQFSISAGHPLASQAGFEILDHGGNAIDAGVAAGLALGVLHSDLVNIAGVAPVMIRMADSGRVISIDGLGTWPRAATAELFESRHAGTIPDGLLRTVVPAAPAAWILALKEYGTLSFAEVARHAIRYAREGFPVFALFAQFISDNQDDYRRYPENQRIYLPEGRPPQTGETFVQSDLAASLQYMADQEAAAGGSRAQGLDAARRAFYEGDIARKICAYHRDHGGLLTRQDMAAYRVRQESPLQVNFAGIDIHCCGPWSQGISLAQAFELLQEIDFASLGHNSPAYIHLLTEVLKLVFADREQHVADPAFVAVPARQMLDREYLRARAALIDPDRAWPEMPPPGDPRNLRPLSNGAVRCPGDQGPGGDAHATRPREIPPTGGPSSADTSYVCVIDRHGNMFSATPSDTSSDTEVIPGTGLCPSSRGCQSHGYSGSINAVAPGKRPRLTPNPALAVKDGRPFMTFGTPGGDVQIQAMLQVFLNTVVYDMDIQCAIESPRFASYSFPSSFAPNHYFPGLLMLEGRLPEDTGVALTARGHRIDWWPDWSWKAGGVLAIVAEAGTGRLHAGADPRRAGAALGR